MTTVTPTAAGTTGYVDPLPYPPGTYLLTTVVPPSPTREYNFAQTIFLIGNEAVRAELRRMVQVVDVLDPSVHAWKAALFKDWFSHFYLMLRSYPVNDEKFFYPYYVKLGATGPAKEHEDNAALLKQFDDLKAVADQLVTDPSNGGVLARLRALAHETAQRFVEHINDVEAFWIPVVERYGQAEKDKMMKAMEKGMDTKGIEFMCCSVLSAMGVAGSVPGIDVPSPGWASTRILNEEFLDKFPGIVKKMLLPKWMRKYQAATANLTACCGSTPPPPPSSRCAIL